MEQAIGLNIIALIIAFFAGLFFGPEGERGPIAFIVFYIGLWVSGIGWFVFVASHFVQKYW